MDSIEQTCDPQRIDNYLEEQLSDPAREEFEHHLCQCEYCQIELQRRAAEPEVWRDAVELLGYTSRDEFSAADTSQSTSGTRCHAFGVLNSLAPTDDPEMLGRIGDYEISGVIGVGGMGAVLKGFDKTLRRVVAIKVMAPHLADSGAARARFHREARAAAAITHNNVIDTYGVAELEGLPYLVMPFARGPSLQKRIDESGPLTTLEVLRIGHQIALGLAAAHEQGLVHRDIKPANILLNEGIERLWITDFGVARAVDDASMTQTGLIAGTPQYMSPEQARGESVDQRSDLFSMGSVLYTACTGRPPFRSEAAYGILRRITDTDPRSIREINPEIPNWLCRIIDRLMAKHPSDRFQDAGEVAELLETCMAHLQQPTQTPLPDCVVLRQDLEHMEPMSTDTHRHASAQPFQGFLRPVVWLAGAMAFLGGLGLLCLHLTQPERIAGHWAGELWTNISLSSVEEATGWYSGSFTDPDGQRGAIQVEWSRLQNRYNGRWKTGDNQSGTLTLRVHNEELRGAIAIDQEWPVESDVSRLREFSWQRVAPSAHTPAPATSDRYHGPAVPMTTPIGGKVVRWGSGIHEHAQVTKGDLIAEIAPLSQSDLKRLERDETQAIKEASAAQTAVQTCERVFKSAQETVDALKSQLKSYEQVKQQMADANTASIDSSKNNIDVLRSKVTEHETVVEQARAELEQQQKLLSKALISESELKTTERELAVAQVRYEQTKAQVQAAQNALIAKQKDRDATLTKSQIDVDQASVELSKAKSEEAKAEGFLETAKLRLQQATEWVVVLQSRKNPDVVAITAPASGYITRVLDSSRISVLNKGDQLCLLWPVEEQQPKRDPVDETVLPEDDKSRLDDAPTGFLPVPASSAQTYATSFDLPIARSIESAMSLGRRLEQTRTNLRAAVGEDESESNVTAKVLQLSLDTLEHERKASVSILQAQMVAAQRLNDSQTQLAANVQKDFESGRLPRTNVMQAEQAAASSRADLQVLQLLLKHYKDLGSPEPAPERGDFALNVLQVRTEAAKQRLEYLIQWSKINRMYFEKGMSDVKELLKAQQSEAMASAELQKLEALVDYYEQIRTTESSVTPLTDESGSDSGTKTPPK